MLISNIEIFDHEILHPSTLHGLLPRDGPNNVFRSLCDRQQTPNRRLTEATPEITKKLKIKAADHVSCHFDLIPTLSESIMPAVMRIQRVTTAGIHELALANNGLRLLAGLAMPNDKMKLRSAAIPVSRHPLRRLKGNRDNWNTQELLVAGSIVTVLSAFAMSEVQCELLGQDEKQTGDDDLLARRKNRSVCRGNIENEHTPLYFDVVYEATKILGCGSFGVVMQCMHKQTGHVAAVKMVQDIEGNQEEVEREKQALECLERAGGHKSIVGYEESYYHNDFHYIVLEYVPGISLHSFLSKYHMPDATRSLRLVSQLANALQFLHKVGIVHCDLKPENIMVLVNDDSKSRSDWHEKNLTLKIIDFGSASRKPQSASMDKLHPTTLSGTRCYWSPEFLQCQDMTPAMDMWALGCLLYILISGHHPFDLTGCSSEDKILQRVQTDTVSFESPVWHNVAMTTKELICGLLEKDPRRRLSADQVLEHLAILEVMKE